MDSTAANRMTPAPPVDDLAQRIISLLDERKADHILSIDVRNKADFADVMIVASGTSNRHVASLAQQVATDLKSIGMMPAVEGLDSPDWVLVDAGDVIVHVFHPEAREYYKLEKMWGVASTAALDAPDDGQDIPEA